MVERLKRDYGRLNNGRNYFISSTGLDYLQLNVLQWAEMFSFLRLQDLSAVLSIYLSVK